MKKQFDVLLLGYYGFGNLGDELLCEAALSLLASCGVPRERAALLSANPCESEEKFGVRAFNRWSIREILRACSASKTLLLGGGGLFQDSTSARSCFYYYSAVRIARMLGLRIWAEGQSVGPLHRRLSRALTRRAFASCCHVGVRDKSSQELLASMGLHASIAPDIVFSLPVERSHDGDALLFNARPGYRALAERTAGFCANLAARDRRKIIGAALSREDEAELKSLDSSGIIKLSDIILISSKEDFSRAASLACGAVGMRLHFLILSALCGLSLAACAYDPKVAALCMRYNITLIDDGIYSLSAPPTEAQIADDDAAVREIFLEGLRASFIANGQN